MKVLFIVVLFLIIATLSGAANASDPFPPGFIGDDRTKEQMDMAKFWKAHRVSRPILSDNSVKAIDGAADVILVSSDRTSLPDGYMALPTSKRQMEAYHGR